MKKVFIILAVVLVSVFTSCTDQTKEFEELNYERKSFTEPGEDGTIIDEDQDDDGEG